MLPQCESGDGKICIIQIAFESLGLARSVSDYLLSSFSPGVVLLTASAHQIFIRRTYLYAQAMACIYIKRIHAHCDYEGI